MITNPTPEPGVRPVMSTLVTKFEALSAACRDPRLARGDLAVLAVILGRCNASSGTCWPGVNRIAADARLDRRNVIRSVQRLESLALIAVERGDRGKSNRYRPSFASSGVNVTSDTHATSGDSVTQLVAPVSPELVAHAPPESLKRTPKGTPKEKQRASAVALTLPEWLPADVWSSWIQHRKAMRKPLTDQAQALSLRTLTALRSDGLDPRTVIETAIERGWQGLFDPRGRSAPTTKPRNSLQSDFQSKDYTAGLEAATP